MSDLIKLLPDSVANQIAAGEVIQRPASAVKELLENALDAGADQIELIIKDAGKTLIQVVDNGQGMSEGDARLCFERHATSKIQDASDLFSIQTMGFRGEALASIAAIARVELKTRTEEDEIGTEVIVEAARHISQKACNTAKGTSISVKNLFFNTPARRNFLKSENVEKRHILQELYRVAMARPDISFQYYQNNQLTHHLPKTKLKQRIVNIFGSNYNQRLVPVEEKTQIVSISGFIGKPEYAKKIRGEQFFFVNGRYIRSPYLAHAVDQAFESLIPSDAHPSFFLFLETEPEQIDVNVHPTKTEIKFQDEKYIYQIVKTAVKRAIGSHHLSPGLDFERETAFDHLAGPGDQPPKPPSIQVNPDYNPFQQGGKSAMPGRQDLRDRVKPSQWEQLFPGEQDVPNIHGEQDVPKIPGQEEGRQYTISPNWDEKTEDNGQKFFQLHGRYILTPVKSGLMVIDQQRAHERVLFEKFKRSTGGQGAASQQLLFPENIQLPEDEANLLKEILDDMRFLGFGINLLSKNTFVIDAIPADMGEEQALQDVVEGVLANVEKNREELRQDMQTNVMRSMARRLSIRPGKALGTEEMAALTNSLFACETPQYTPGGQIVLQILDREELTKRFK